MEEHGTENWRPLAEIRMNRKEYNRDPLMSSQPCGCDEGANHKCEWHTAAEKITSTGPGYSEPGIPGSSFPAQGLRGGEFIATTFIVKNEGIQETSPSGVKRNVVANKIDYMNIIHGPMFDRWAEHLTKAKDIYPDVKPGVPNWTQANSEEDMIRFRKSAFRHFRQWLRGDMDEDHAAAVYWNINGYEFTKAKLEDQ